MPRDHKAHSRSSAELPETLITGRKPLLEALEQGHPIEKVFVLHGTHGPVIDSIFRAAKSRGIPIRQSPRDRFQQLTRGKEAQGVAGIISQVAYLELEELLEKAARPDAVLLILDEIEDPHNLGALLRSALSFGIAGVIIPRHHAATVNQTVIKTSAGAALSMPIARVGNIAQTVESLRESGYWVVGTAADGEKTIGEISAEGKLALVVGNEGKGIRRLVKEKCDQLVRIPMKGTFESLNASVAGAIVMFEVMRKRAGGQPGRRTANGES